jgi:hypothetical protein
MALPSSLPCGSYIIQLKALENTLVMISFGMIPCTYLSNLVFVDVHHT